MAPLALAGCQAPWSAAETEQKITGLQRLVKDLSFDNAPSFDNTLCNSRQ
jgi:hypothetical protein